MSNVQTEPAPPPTAPPTNLQLTNVSRHYRDGDATITALDDVSLSVSAGEMVAVTGRSGSGKSTLINVAGGLEEPSSGDITVTGKPLTGSPAALAVMRRRTIGYVFQNLNLIEDLTVVENVALPVELDGVRPRVARQVAMIALKEVGLEDTARRFPHALSGGQRQRIAIARAIAEPQPGQRKLVLADEPTGALDDLTARSVYDLLAGLAADGLAVVVATHDHELAAYADRVVRLRDGGVEHISERSQAPATVAELLAEESA